ncbi:flagellar biosynthesis anti-sigma factor FlgM [Syntrophomonas erecta]
MIISRTQVHNILKLYGKDPASHRVDKPQESRGKARPDDLAISSESRMKQKAMQAIKQAPDIRMDKVKDLQERISAGTYTLSADEVAEKMIERAIVDHLI